MYSVFILNSYEVIRWLLVFLGDKYGDFDVYGYNWEIIVLKFLLG